MTSQVSPDKQGSDICIMIKVSDKYLPFSLNNSGFSFHAFWRMINKPLGI